MSTGKATYGEGSVYQRASDGKWVGSVRLGNGKRKTIYRATRKEAQAALRALLGDVDAGRPVTTGRTMTLGAYLTAWLVRIAGEVDAGHLRPRTADSYRDLITRHVLGTELARVKLNALSVDDVRRWQRERLATPSGRVKAGTDPADAPTLSARTVGLTQAVLRRALNDAMRDELLARNVAALVRLPAAQRGADGPTEAEIGKVVVVAREHARAALWLVILGLGLRRGEALALRWSLLDLDAGTVTIAAQLGRVRGKLVESATKTTGSAARLALPAFLVAVLRQHRAAQLRDRMAAPVWGDDDLVFTTSIGTPIEPRNLNREWSRICQDAGVRPLRIHDLRHAAASLAFAAGADPKAIQAQLRHTRLSTTTDVYTHVFDSVKQGTADRMDDVLRRLGGAQ